MDGPRTVTAHFVETPNYTITTSVTGQGSITLNPPGGTYRSNSVVQLTANAASGWIFTTWSGDASGSDNPLSFTVLNNKSISANFDELAAITTPPQDVLTNIGSTIRFAVEARGSHPLTYQWSFGGRDLPAATNSSLTLTDVQAADEGRYTITIAGPHNSETASALLTLTDAPCTGTNVVSTPSESALRTAIATGGYIRLCFNGTITLTEQLNINKDVVLDATGREVIISGNNATRLFYVQTNINLAITNVTLTAGRHRGGDHPVAGRPAFGGAIWNQGGSVALSHCVLSNNVALGGHGIDSATNPAPGGSASGGAILNDHGTLLISSSVISSNTAIGGWGGATVSTRAPGGKASGGAIASLRGTLSLVDVIVEHNFAQTGVGGFNGIEASGGAVYIENAMAFIRGSVFQTNRAAGIDAPITPGGPSVLATPAAGGAIRFLFGFLEIDHSQFLGNIAQAGGGYSSAPARGGAICSDGLATVLYSTFCANTALGGGGRFGGEEGRGGAWFNNGVSAASESVFYENTALGGDALNGTSPQPRGTGSGGAIANAGLLYLTNITAALNVARGGVNRGFIPSSGNAEGGGIANLGANAELTAVNITSASNAVAFSVIPEGGTYLGANIFNSNGVVALRNSITAYPNGANSNVYGAITDAGHNISSDASANFNSGTSFNFTDPRLEPLADNGGPTLTMALRSNSPAIDFGDSLNAPATDQRGFPRPSGNGVDIGAFERGATAGTTPNLGIQLQSNGRVLIWFVDGSSNNYELQSSTNLVNWQMLETFNGSSEFTREFPTEGAARFFRVIQR
jgi:hypothetical protein